MLSKHFMESFERNLKKKKARVTFSYDEVPCMVTTEEPFLVLQSLCVVCFG